MTTTKFLRATTVLIALIAFNSFSLEAKSPDYKVYTLQEGDTLKEISTKFMGGPESIIELLEYNEIANPGAVLPGLTLIIPLGIRDNALQALDLAEQGLLSAIDAKAEVYARAQYMNAQTSLEHARDARNKARYDQAIALAELARAKSNDRQKTPQTKNAWVQQRARVKAATGIVEISLDDGKTWRRLRDGSPVNVSSLVRTQGDSRAEIEFADGTFIQVMESSEVHIEDYLVDRRSGERVSKLKVKLGNILGKVKPKEVEASKFEVKTEGASIAIRGTELRIGSEDESTTVSVLHGLVNVESEDTGDLVEVPGGLRGLCRKRPSAFSPYRVATPTEYSAIRFRHYGKR